MSLSRGFRVGPYEILGPLGEGGMGAVYRARDPRLDRDVAIKVLRADVMADQDRKTRFLQEAKAVSALNHPNIVTVYDIGAEGDIAYLVMELVDGRGLDQMIPASGLRAVEVLRIGTQIADACARAHAAGIIHRDLKPANVMLQTDGRVKVLDFGLAKLVDTSGPDFKTVATRTAAGTIMGTAAYMSPEQAEGKPLDVRTDIFSLGALLYELCTGKRAFQGDSQASVLAEVLRQDPRPPGEIRTDLPPELARLVMRCLRKDPARRVQSMADLNVALAELKEEADSGKLSAQMPVGVPAVSKRLTFVLAAAVAVLLAVAGFFAWRGLGEAPAPAEAALQPVPLTSYPGSETSASFSPDGSQVAFVWNGERADNPDVYVKLIGSGPPLRLTTDLRPEVLARWSPDGRNIALIRILNREVFDVVLVPPLGGPERKVAQFQTRVGLEGALASLSWTPDSKYLFVSGGRAPGEPNHLQRVSLDTGEVKTLVSFEGVADGYTSLALAPDGRTLAAVRLDSGSRKVELIAISDAFEVESTKILASVKSNVGAVRWTADSRDLLYSVAVNTPLPLYRVSVSGGDPVPLTWVGAGALGPAVSPVGNRMVFSRDFRDTNIWRVTLATRANTPPEPLAASTFRDVYPQYSPDGKRLVFYSNRGGSVQIWTSDADGSRAVPLTSMDAMATTGTPRWSPDGERISFDSNVGGGYHIYLTSADGGQPRALTSGNSNNFIAAWSPDSRWIYFSSDRGGQLDVWKMPAEGGEPEQITRQGGQAPSLSPDGKWVYFTKKDGVAGVWKVPANGGEESRVLDAIFRYNFTVTEDGIYFVPPAERDRTSSVRFLNFKTGATSEIAKISKPVDLGLAVSPDGRELLFTQIDYLGTDLMLVEGFR